MKLRYITFTGADDRTDPVDMVELSRQHPRIEWGILLSSSPDAHLGLKFRFPSFAWFHSAREIFAGSGINLSGHLCGGCVDDILQGRFTVADLYGFDASFFQRYQINFRGITIPHHTYLYKSLAHHSQQVIFQQSDGIDDIFFRAWASGVQPVALFDASGGRGIIPDEWQPVMPGYCGYAGGFGPDNLEDQLKRLADHVGDREIWIDMETGIRGDQDRFDLDRVRRCVEIAEPYF